MRRFTNILFSPLGAHGNPAAVRRVARLAGENGAEVTVFGVVAEPTRLQRLLHRSDLIDRATAAEQDRVEKLLARLAATGGVHTSPTVAMGDPAVRIVERVLRDHHDLVVVSTGADRQDAATIRRLLRKCPCPVWVLRPTRARIQRVLAAVNPDPEEIGLNRLILELAASMVELHGGELHLVHAWELYGEQAFRGSAFVHLADEDVEALLEEERARHERAVRDLLHACHLTEQPWDVHLIKGSPDTMIPALVAKRRINVLVMGTVARTGVNRLIMGNTAERVLDDVTCSVIAVKPEGFVSPIRAPAA